MSTAVRIPVPRVAVAALPPAPSLPLDQLPADGSRVVTRRSSTPSTTPRPAGTLALAGRRLTAAFSTSTIVVSAGRLVETGEGRPLLFVRGLRALAEVAQNIPFLRADPPRHRRRSSGLRPVRDAGQDDLDHRLRPHARRPARRARHRCRRLVGDSMGASSRPSSRRLPAASSSGWCSSPPGLSAENDAARHPGEARPAPRRAHRLRLRGWVAARSAAVARRPPAHRGLGLVGAPPPSPAADADRRAGQRRRQARSLQALAADLDYDFRDRLDRDRVPDADRLGRPRPRHHRRATPTVSPS